MGLSRKFILKSVDVLAALKAVDGTGSYLDADLLDGLHASQILSQAQAAVTDLTRYTAAANKIPMGGSNGKLDISWIPNMDDRFVPLIDYQAHVQTVGWHTTLAKQVEWDSKAAGNHSHTPASLGAETPAGSQAKANIAETNAKAYADSLLGNVVATLDSINGEVI